MVWASAGVNGKGKGKGKKGKVAMASTATTSPLPSNALAEFQAEVTKQWESSCQKHAAISESIGTKDFAALMTHDPEDPHGIRALAPNGLQPCAGTIRGYGEEVQAFTSKFEVFIPAAEEELQAMMQLEMSSDNDYDAIQSSLQLARVEQIRAVEGSKMALENMNGNMSLGQALLLRHTQEVVDGMDDDKKTEEFEKLERQLRRELVQRVEDGVGKLLAESKLPGLHDVINLKRQLKDTLEEKAADVTSKRHDADVLYAELLKHQAEVREQKQKCIELRGKTIRTEETERKALEEAERARQKAWEKYRDAFVRREAAAMMEDTLEAADEMITEEVEAAGNARAQTAALCEECEVKAAIRTTSLIASIEAAHGEQLDYSRPSVKEAWKNTAFASQLCKCVVAAKRTDIAQLRKEQALSEERAQRQKQPKKKAQTLEKVEKLGRQIAEITEELDKFGKLSARAEEHLNSFRCLKSGLDEAAIASYAQEAASGCFGNSKLYVSDEDSDDSTEASGSTEAIQPHLPNVWEKKFIEMEEKHKTEKQQLLMEFQIRMDQMEERMRQMQVESQRDDASNASTLGFERL